MMKEISEGGINFTVPEGDVTKKLPVFYNPHMKFDRDLTIAVLNSFGGEKYCDCLAGSGVRGMRAAAESDFDDVFVNDISSDAIALAKKNFSKNSLSAKFYCEDVNLFLRRFKCDKFDAIDIDPFGSSIVALDSALRAVDRKHGLLCLTFTDTAPLCGVSIKTCQRRYDARPIRSSYAKEVGLRILVASCVRMAAKYELSLTPILCYNRRHYFRLFLKTSTGVPSANAAISNISFIQHCFSCDWRDYVGIDSFYAKCPNCASHLSWAGPLWSSEFTDPDFCRGLELHDPAIKKMVELIANEQKIKLPFFDLHHLAGLNRTLAPKKDLVVEELSNLGLKATKTHFSKTGIRVLGDISHLYSFFS